MKNIRWWAFWRRLQYGTGFFFVIGIFLVTVYYGYLFTPANCFDNVMNGREMDVDCGGRCARICAFTMAPPNVVWAESFAITDSQYNAVAYVENRNENGGVPSLPYTLTLLDEDGVIAERKGTTVLPPGSTYPIFEGRINTNGRTPTETIVTLGTASLWLPSTFDRSQFRTSDIDLVGSDERPRLTAAIENGNLDEVQNLEVVATIFDARGNALTSSQTYIDLIPGRSTVDAVFTWPRPIAKTVRSCVVPTDIVLAIDLSGSMNNDGGTPPQPISDVLEAAGNFISQVREEDQVSVVTFASDSKINLPLTGDMKVAINTVSRLSIDPKEERGSTNTGAALSAAFEELNSARHNIDARSVVVLLTDGLATAPDEAPDVYANAQANTLKEDDVTIYTIGLGTEVNMSFLRQIASEAQFAYAAPNTSTLGSIYRQITAALCEDGVARIDIIPKTDGGFAPYP